MNKHSFSILEFAVIALCAILSVNLYISWYSAPFERGGWIAFLLWLAPIPFYWFLQPDIPRKKNVSAALLGIALVFSILGTLSSFNTIHYFSLAIALSALIPFRWPMTFWVLLAVVWMPGFGWIISQYIPHYEMLVRIAIIALTSIGIIAYMYKTEPET